MDGWMFGSDGTFCARLWVYAGIAKVESPLVEHLVTWAAFHYLQFDLVSGMFLLFCTIVEVQRGDSHKA